MIETLAEARDAGVKSQLVALRLLRGYEANQGVQGERA